MLNFLVPLVADDDIGNLRPTLRIQRCYRRRLLKLLDEIAPDFVRLGTLLDEMLFLLSGALVAVHAIEAQVA